MLQRGHRNQPQTDTRMSKPALNRDEDYSSEAKQRSIDLDVV